MWKTTEIDLGRIKESTNHVVDFELVSIPDGFKMEVMTPSCGCSTPTYNDKTGVISVKYVPGKVPSRMRFDKKQYSTRKTITVQTNMGTSILAFKSTVTV